MKRIFLTIFSLLLILTLSVGFFSCKKESEPAENAATLSTEALARAAVDAALPNGQSNAENAARLLSVLSNAGLEETEVRSVLSALKDAPSEGLASVFTDLSARTYSMDRFGNYRACLQIVSGAVSPELAGEVFFTVAKEKNANLPFTAEDCRKLSSLLLSQDSAFGTDMLKTILQEGYSATNERQLTTVLRSLAAALQQTIGISSGAKEYLYSLAEKGIDYLISLADNSQTDKETLEKTKEFFLSLAAVLRDGYDAAVTYTVAFLSKSDARLFLGLPYEKKETTLYYGYSYADWKMHLLTKEEYDARAYDYDEYFEKDELAKGFTVEGAFLPFSKEDAALSDRAYRLYVAYQAYASMPEADRISFRSTFESFLRILSNDQTLVATLLNREIIPDSGESAASFDEMISALSTLSSYNATDGISDSERILATAACDLFESYLHEFLPRVF